MLGIITLLLELELTSYKEKEATQNNLGYKGARG